MSKKNTPSAPDGEGRIVVFQEQAIRRTWHEDQWWFSVIDVVGVLSESRNANRYWSDLKRKLAQEAGSGQPYEKIVRLKLAAPDGKQRETDCANTETLFRIIQSIPSPKAEPFKRWLAQVGYERVREIEDPERASARARELYEAKGYPKDWIEKRMRSIAIRGALTDEWKARGVAEGREYSILTAEIARATFGHLPRNNVGGFASCCKLARTPTPDSFRPVRLQHLTGGHAQIRNALNLQPAAAVNAAAPILANLARRHQILAALVRIPCGQIQHLRMPGQIPQTGLPVCRCRVSLTARFRLILNPHPCEWCDR